MSTEDPFPAAPPGVTHEQLKQLGFTVNQTSSGRWWAHCPGKVRNTLTSFDNEVEAWAFAEKSWSGGNE